MIEFRTLGEVGLLDVDGEEIRSVVAQPKRLALLSYLALARPRGFHRRNTLLVLFWPDRDEKHARWSLNQALRHLRRGVGDEVVLSRGRDEVGLDFASISLDAAAFEEACEESRLDAALELYRGDLLAGFHIPGCIDLEHWLEGERTRLRRLAVSAAWALADRLEDAGELAAAASAARRALGLSPSDGEGIRRLIDLLDRAGDRAGAVQAYEDYATNLQTTLEIEPAPETQALIAAVRSRQRTHGGTSALIPAEGPDSDSSPERGDASDSNQALSGDLSPPRRASHRPAFTILVLAAVVLLALVGQRFVASDAGETGRWYADTVPAVAVLPFRVSGASEAYLSEGMADLLFGSLDGLTGIRPISSFTVLARWNERVEGDAWPDLTDALAVAVAAGARYAIVGNAVDVGTEVRFAAGLYDVAGSGTVLAQANETAPLDDIWGAVDRLSVRLMRSLGEIGQGELARIDSREVTTGSPEALKAYLRARVSYRRAEFEAAAADYELAIEEDSTFALAHFGLGWSLAWEPLSRTERASERPGHWQSALAHSRTERQRLMARASLSYEGERMSPDVADELRTAVGRNPDDAHLWYLLGEHYLHVGTATGAFDDHGGKAEQAFEQAVELVPDFLPYSAHLVDLAFIQADPDRVSELGSRIARLVPPSSHVAREYRTLSRVFFEAIPETVEFEAALDTLEMLDALPRLDLELLAQPSLWPTTEAIGVRLRRSAPGWKDCRYRQHSLTPGFLERYLEEAFASPAEAWCLYLAQMFGLPMPEQTVDSVMTERLDSMLTGRESFPWDVGVPLYFADRGQWPKYDKILDLWRAQSLAAPSAESNARVRWSGYFVTATEAYGEWKRGNPERAVTLLESLPPEARVWHAFRWWLGTLYMELDRPADAVAQFRTLQGVYNAPNWMLAYYRLGEAYEQLGETENAREQYAYFVDAWEEADPELQPLVEKARARLRELAGGRD